MICERAQSDCESRACARALWDVNEGVGPACLVALCVSSPPATDGSDAQSTSSWDK